MAVPTVGAKLPVAGRWAHRQVTYLDSSVGVMIASGVMARVRRILPTPHAAVTKEAIASATARRSVGPVLPSDSTPTPSQIAAKKAAEAKPRTIAGAV